MTEPSQGAISVHAHRVRFYETDAMGIVHHANYLLYLENARIAFLDEYDLPYREYVAQGLHFAVTQSHLSYHQPAHFDDMIETATWLAWVRGASLCMGYASRRGEDLLLTGSTQHALVDESGRPRRLPAERRDHMKKLAQGPYSKHA